MNTEPTRGSKAYKANLRARMAAFAKERGLTNPADIRRAYAEDTAALFARVAAKVKNATK